MIQTTIRPIDVLAPPVNPWLKDLTHCRSTLPNGVRIVRFSEETDDATDPAIPAEAVAQGTAKRRR